MQIYPKGVHVKHVRGLFQALGLSNAAEPGNPSHFRLFVSAKFWVTRVLECQCIETDCDLAT